MKAVKTERRALGQVRSVCDPRRPTAMAEVPKKRPYLPRSGLLSYGPNQTISCCFSSARSTGMRQEVDIRYVVTSLEGSAQHLRERLLPARTENLIKLHKAQLASDRISCHSATANQVRLVLHTAAFWLMHGVRAAIPQTSPLASAEFATIRERLIKIGARVIHVQHALHAG
jgi:hypothetical protein